MFQCVASNLIPSLDFLEKTQCLPLYRYAEDGTQVENITDWALNQFQKQYLKKGNRDSGNGKRAKSQSTTPDSPITKTDIFHYVYAVLHQPAYRAKYEINLKREFPRIPFYENFNQWSQWGKQLMDLHLNYEKVEPFGLKRLNV